MKTKKNSLSFINREKKSSEHEFLLKKLQQAVGNNPFESRSGGGWHNSPSSKVGGGWTRATGFGVD